MSFGEGVFVERLFFRLCVLAGGETTFRLGLAAASSEVVDDVVE